MHSALQIAFWAGLIAITASTGCSQSVTPISIPAGAGNSPDAWNDVDHSHFRFVYAGKVVGLQPGTSAQIWLPIAGSDDDQQVLIQEIDLPTEHQDTYEQSYGNLLAFLVAEADANGEIPLRIVYDVRRRPVEMERLPIAARTADERFLKSTQHVPFQAAEIQQLLQQQPPPDGDTLQVAEFLCRVVADHMQYGKPADQPWGRGDAVWACQSGIGNCSDYHSLFMALAGNQEIPVRFEIGFPIPPDQESGDIPGYHCWARFNYQKKWIPVDIAQADREAADPLAYFGNLPADRVLFTVGRDLALSPRQQGEEVNFLVYPYVEVDGVRHTDFEPAFSFERLRE